MAGGDFSPNLAQLVMQNPSGFDQNWLKQQLDWPQGSMYATDTGFSYLNDYPGFQSQVATRSQTRPLEEKINNLAAQLAKQQPAAPAAPAPAAPDPTAFTPRPPAWNPADFGIGPSVGLPQIPMGGSTGLPPFIDISKTLPPGFGSEVI